MTSWVPCEKCDGTGDPRIVVNGCWRQSSGFSMIYCPTCSGLGELPSEGLVEAVKSAIGASFVEQMGWGESKPMAALQAYAVANDQARAALVAARVWEKENS